MPTVRLRYIVDDIDAAIAFYCDRLGFTEVMHPAPAFAMLARGDLRLALSAPNPEGGGGQAMPAGTVPEPAGWNRVMLQGEELEGLVSQVPAARAHRRTVRGT